MIAGIDERDALLLQLTELQMDVECAEETADLDLGGDWLPDAVDGLAVRAAALNERLIACEAARAVEDLERWLASRDD